jgi:segregation and condensation protein B
VTTPEPEALAAESKNTDPRPALSNKTSTPNSSAPLSTEGADLRAAFSHESSALDSSVPPSSEGVVAEALLSVESSALDSDAPLSGESPDAGAALSGEAGASDSSASFAGDSTDPRAVLSDVSGVSDSRAVLSNQEGAALISERRSQASAEQAEGEQTAGQQAEGEQAEGEQVDGEAVEESDLPPLADDADLTTALEALLLVVDAPAGEELLATTLDQSVARITEALHRMSADLTTRGSGIDLRHIGDGWRFVTRDKYAPYVEKLLLDGQRAKLTRAALETLAVIAYRQPVTRSRVAAVRGVNVDGVIRTLVSRGLIAETGTDSETGGILYRTTELFLERLGLSSLEDLPAIAPLLPEVDAIDDV